MNQSSDFVDLIRAFNGHGVESKRALIANKKASGRMQDLADVERLEHPSD